MTHAAVIAGTVARAAVLALAALAGAGALTALGARGQLRGDPADLLLAGLALAGGQHVAAPELAEDVAVLAARLVAEGEALQDDVEAVLPGQLVADLGLADRQVLEGDQIPERTDLDVLVAGVDVHHLVLLLVHVLAPGAGLGQGEQTALGVDEEIRRGVAPAADEGAVAQSDVDVHQPGDLLAQLIAEPGVAGGGGRDLGVDLVPGAPDLLAQEALQGLAVDAGLPAAVAQRLLQHQIGAQLAVAVAQEQADAAPAGLVVVTAAGAPDEHPGHVVPHAVSF